MRNITLLLHDIRSVHNVGSIFRTAECLGISRIILSGCTPSPVDRFMRKRSDFAKVALGAEESIPWESLTDVDPLLYIEGFKKQHAAQGGKVVLLEQDPKAVDYKTVDFGEDASGEVAAPILVLAGNEVSGAPASHRAASDIIAEIPQAGLKESLNVSVALAIVLFRWFDKRSI